MIERLKQIYMDGFSEDGEKYANYFCAKNEKMAVVFPETNPVSAGYIIPKKLYNSDACVYFSALATLKSERGKGNASALIAKMLNKASENYSFAVLSPFNSSFYKKYGFFTTQSAQRYTISGNDNYELCPAQFSDLMQINELFKPSVHPFLSEEYLLNLIEETSNYSATPVVLKNQNKIVGFCVKEANSLSRVLYKDIDFSNVANFNGFSYKRANNEGDAFIQIRILSVVNFVKYLKSKCDFILTVKVEDDIISRNNQVFELSSIKGVVFAQITEKPHTVCLKIDNLVEYLVHNGYIENFETQFIDEY